MIWYEHLYDYTGTIADWVMAAAAVYASIKAKDYFKSKNDEIAYNSAVDFFDVQCKKLFGIKSDFIYSMNSLIEYLQEVNISSLHERVLKNHLTSIESSIPNASNCFKAIFKNHHVIAKHKWKIKKKYSAEYSEIIFKTIELETYLEIIKSHPKKMLYIMNNYQLNNFSAEKIVQFDVVKSELIESLLKFIFLIEEMDFFSKKLSSYNLPANEYFKD